MKNTLTEMGVPRAYKTEADARKACRERLADCDVLILHSPHAGNKNGDYFVEIDTMCIIRNCETELYCGIGRDA